MSAPRWRTGRRVKLNVYRDDEPMFQCHTPEQATEVVALLNLGEQASADTERLDWLLTNTETVVILREWREGNGVLILETREAIDAARSGKP